MFIIFFDREIAGLNLKINLERKAENFTASDSGPKYVFLALEFLAWNGILF